MLIAARQSMLMGGAKLPYDAEVEYLESTGAQWIDTGILANSDLKVECTFRMLERPTSFKWIFAARMQDIIGGGYGFGCDGTGYITSDYNGRVSISERFNSGTIYTVVKDANVCSINGTTLLNTATVFTQSYTLPILGMRTADGAVNLGVIPKCEIFYVRIYAPTLVRDYIPVRVGSGSSAVGYLYDRTNPTGGPLGNGLYGNAGTGAFVIGPDKEHLPYRI